MPGTGTTPHQATGQTTTSPTGTTTAPISYDRAGNVTTRTTQTAPATPPQAQTLAWNAEGRLVQTVQAGQTTRFAYHVDGSRLIRRDDATTVLSLGDTELTLTRATNTVTAQRYVQYAGQSVAMRTGYGGICEPQRLAGCAGQCRARRAVLPGNRVMTRVRIRSFVRRRDGSFLEIGEVSAHSGERLYLPGALSFTVDGAELFDLDLWDDINWLWPLLVQMIADWRRTGSGKTGFPGQPIAITAERVWAGHTLIRVTDGGTIKRSVVAPDEELFEAIVASGLEFFREWRRLSPEDPTGLVEERILASWVGSRGC